jgi:hypothetical protein
VACLLTYIPEYLHTNEREPITEFYLHEHLYRRCSPEEKENPFAKISLVDLSVNRRGSKENILCSPSDVLYNMNPDINNNKEQVENQVVVILEIFEIATCNTYDKLLTHGNNSCIIYLRHKPESCNYAHAAFELYYNGKELTFDNYKTLLGTNAQNKLRTKCRQELATMILREEVRIHW